MPSSYGCNIHLQHINHTLKRCQFTHKSCSNSVLLKSSVFVFVSFQDSKIHLFVMMKRDDDGLQIRRGKKRRHSLNRDSYLRWRDDKCLLFSAFLLSLSSLVCHPRGCVAGIVGREDFCVQMWEAVRERCFNSSLWSFVSSSKCQSLSPLLSVSLSMMDFLNFTL